MFQVYGSITNLRHLGSSVFFAASLALLSSCVSTGKLKPDSESKTEQASADDVPVVAGSETDQQVAAAAQMYRDPRVVAANGGQQEAGYPTQTAMMPENQGEPGPLVLQSTGLKATSSSIFAAGPARALVPFQQPTAEGAAPVSNSLFNAGQPVQQAVPIDTTTPQATILPPKAGKDAAAGQPAPLPQDELGAASPIPTPAAEAEVATIEHSTQKSGSGDKGAAVEALSLAGLFSAKRKGRQNPAQSSDLPHDQVAALGYTAWPSNRALSMFATVQDDDPNHDDESSAIQMAALPGLARLAPNGLWLQTERVETGCFKPELMGLLKSVERRYGEKVIVTSGHRDVAHNAAVGGAPLSRHITCEAADIQVPGVSKWELAAYLRALPGRGGVGTYCHTQSVHIDVGKRRDWNWGCTRKV